MDENENFDEDFNESNEDSFSTSDSSAASKSDKSFAVSPIRIWQVATVLLLVVSIFLFLRSPTSTAATTSLTGAVVSVDESGKAIVNYLNENLLPAGTEAVVDSAIELGDLYQVNLTISGRQFSTYATKDGKFLFPSVIDMSQPVEKAAEPESVPIEKSDKPKVELYVMSQCPYGVQAENAMLPVVEKFGDKIDFELNFIANAAGDGFNSLHGQPEVDENIAQLCALKHYPEKAFEYILCRNEESVQGSYESCAKDLPEVKTCVEGDEGKALLRENIKKADEKSIGGSPTILINSGGYSGGRTQESFKKAICSAFNVEPELCNQTLDDTASTASGNC